MSVSIAIRELASCFLIFEAKSKIQARRFEASGTGTFRSSLNDLTVDVQWLGSSRQICKIKIIIKASLMSHAALFFPAKVGLENKGGLKPTIFWDKVPFHRKAPDQSC